MKIKVGLVGKGKWGLKIKKKLQNLADLKFTIGKSNKISSIIKKKDVQWIFIVTPNKTHYSIVKKCLMMGVNVYCEKPLSPSFIQAKALINLAKRKKLKLFVSDLYNFYTKKLKKLNMRNTVYRAKFVNEKNPEFLNRFMYHDISIFYKFLKRSYIKKEIIRLHRQKKIYTLTMKLKNKKEIKFEYNFGSKKKEHIVNNLNIKSKKDFLKLMIKNVLEKKINFQENNLKALFIVNLLNTIKGRIKYAN